MTLRKLHLFFAYSPCTWKRVALFQECRWALGRIMADVQRRECFTRSGRRSDVRIHNFVRSCGHDHRIMGIGAQSDRNDRLKNRDCDAAKVCSVLYVCGGLCVLGSRLKHTSAFSGFAMELGTAFTVLIASKVGIPVSTTHCAVGAVVSVGWMKSHKGGVSWKTFRNIAIAWIVTLPVAGAVSALVAFLLNRFLVYV